MSATTETTGVTALEWHARLLESAADSLAHWIETTGEKADWCPDIDGSVNTRSALQLGAECTMVNNSFAALLSGREPSSEMPQFSSVGQCSAALKESARDLAKVVRSLPESAISDKYETKMLGDLSGGAIMAIALGNMYYHGGQVNLIQLLCGDAEFHIPPGFASV